MQLKYIAGLVEHLRWRSDPEPLPWWHRWSSLFLAVWRHEEAVQDGKGFLAALARQLKGSRAAAINISTAEAVKKRGIPLGCAGHERCLRCLPNLSHISAQNTCRERNHCDLISRTARQARPRYCYKIGHSTVSAMETATHNRWTIEQ